MQSITILDMVLAGVMLISGVLAMLRGFTREILSIAAWAGAAGAGYFVFKNYKQEIAELVPIQPEIAAVAGVAGLVFLVTLIVISVATIKIGDRILDSSVGALDRTFGLLFGFARGLILIGILAWFFLKFFSDDKWQSYIDNSYSGKVVLGTRDGLDNLGRRLMEKVDQQLNPEGGTEDQ